MGRKNKRQQEFAGDQLIEPGVTRNPCPACGSMLYTDGTCTNIECESYPPERRGVARG